MSTRARHTKLKVASLKAQNAAFVAELERERNERAKLVSQIEYEEAVNAEQNAMLHRLDRLETHTKHLSSRCQTVANARVKL